MGKRKSKPYSQRTDSEKVMSNWTKTRGLYQRGEYSLAILRAATTIELAVNLAVRAELAQKRHLPLQFVDRLLKRANGLRNKYHDLLLPITDGEPRNKQLKKLWKKISKVNDQRNRIAHSGEFKKRSTAGKQLTLTCEILNELVSQYIKNFSIKRIEK